MPSFRYLEGAEKAEVEFDYNPTRQSLDIGGKSYRCGKNYVEIRGRRTPFWVHRSGTTAQVWLDGEIYSFEIDDPRQRARSEGSGGSAGGSVKAKMPGKILQVSTKVGDLVKEGDNLLLMESMKMELALNSPVTGTVSKVEVVPEQMVSQGQLLVEITEDDD